MDLQDVTTIAVIRMGIRHLSKCSENLATCMCGAGEAIAALGTLRARLDQEREIGYSDGFSEGYDQGYADGQDDAEEDE